MANMEFNGFETEEYGGSATNSGRKTQRMLHLAGAAMSIGLICGAGYWGYAIAVRDVSGVPVVRALEVPMRSAPSNPGGDEVDYQGLSVNWVAAAGIAAPVAERVILAPRAQELTEEDGPGLAATAPQVAEVEAAAPSDTVASAPLKSGAVALVAELSAPKTTGTGPETLVEAALSEALGEPTSAPPKTEAVLDDSIAPASTFEFDPQLASLRPMRRPVEIAAPVDEGLIQATPAVALAESDEIDPASLTAGTRLVQLGAFDDVETARAEWIRLAGSFSAEFAGKARIVQEAQSGGRTFIRLRAHGFDDEDAARAFCAALLAQDAVCIPVAVQ
jgi:hypothetical protein